METWPSTLAKFGLDDPFEPARAAPRMRKALRDATPYMDVKPPALERVEDLTVPGAAGDIPARLYVPFGSVAPASTCLFMHGGGYVIGDLETHDRLCQRLAAHGGVRVLAIDYRLAPEHPFPAAHEDAMAASRWIIDNLNALAPNNGEVVIAGDSAGGNLTLATAVRLPDEPRLRGCLMIYPAMQHYHAAMRSYTEHAKSGPLTTSIMRWFMDTYLDGLAPADPATEIMFPGKRIPLSGFPRSLLVTAEKDPLRDDGRRLANALQRAGVTVQHEHFSQEAHGFPCSEGPTPGHERFMSVTKGWIESISAR